MRGMGKPTDQDLRLRAVPAFEKWFNPPAGYRLLIRGLGLALAVRLKKLADRGIYLGTSSWNYPGWLGQV